MYQDLNRRRLTTELFGTLAPLVPRASLMHDGPKDYQSFKDSGQEYLNLLRELCGLSPTSHILDVGCGIGRKTFPLVRYLDATLGRYEGLDIVRTGIEWCRQHYTPRYPNFHFQLIDVYNGMYNPTASRRAAEYNFPFPDQSFDVVVLGSVFTHMLTRDFQRYLMEVSRVLKKGGCSLITYFLLNAESIALIAQGKSTLNLVHPVDGCRVVDANHVERAVGFDETFVRDQYRAVDLNIRRDEVLYGSWCGRQKFLSYQDIIVAERQMITAE
jgi:ubiquinone/menaquinone biosynthesis C-methylase UbiE